MWALHTLNSDNLERSFVRINPTHDFFRVFHSMKAATGWHHTKHINSCPPPETQQNSQYWEQSWVKTVFLERCIICMRYIYFYPALALEFKKLKCPNLFNKTRSAQNGWDFLEGYFPISWMLIFVCLKSQGSSKAERIEKQGVIQSRLWIFSVVF